MCESKKSKTFEVLSCRMLFLNSFFSIAFLQLSSNQGLLGFCGAVDVFVMLFSAILLNFAVKRATEPPHSQNERL